MKNSPFRRKRQNEKNGRPKKDLKNENRAELRLLDT